MRFAGRRVRFERDDRSTGLSGQDLAVNSAARVRIPDSDSGPRPLHVSRAGALIAFVLIDNQRIRSWALCNVSIHFFRPTCSSFDRGGSRTWRQPSRPTTPGSESVTPSLEL